MQEQTRHAYDDAAQLTQQQQSAESYLGSHEFSNLLSDFGISKNLRHHLWTPHEWWQGRHDHLKT